MLNGEIKTGSLDIPANSSSGRVSFQNAFPDGAYKVFLTNVYVNSRKIIYSIASLDETGFNIYPFDTTTEAAPGVAMQVYWVAIRKK